MLQVLVKLLIAALLLLGLVDLFRILLFALLRTRNSGKVYFVLKLRGHDTEAELKLRNALGKVKWMGGREKKEVLCVDCGMDEETMQVCRMMARDEPVLRLCTPETLPNILEEP